MIEYNQVGYYTTDNKVGICPIEGWDKKQEKVSIQLFALLDLTESEIIEVYGLHAKDQHEFALLVQDYIGMYPTMVMN